MRKPLALLLFATLAACAGDPTSSAVTGDGARITRGTPAEGRSPAVIPVMAGAPSRPYRVLEDMTATARQITVFGKVPTNADVDADLRKRAAELNADAVINVRYGQQGVGMVSWSQISGTGQAIKYTGGR